MCANICSSFQICNLTFYFSNKHIGQKETKSRRQLVNRARQVKEIQMLRKEEEKKKKEEKVIFSF